jgi:hypothetical protein
MERLMDQLVCDVRAVELGGVDVIDPCLDGSPQHRDGCISILRRTKDAGAGELHRAKTHTVNAVASK